MTPDLGILATTVEEKEIEYVDIEAIENFEYYVECIAPNDGKLPGEKREASGYKDIDVFDDFDNDTGCVVPHTDTEQDKALCDSVNDE